MALAALTAVFVVAGAVLGITMPAAVPHDTYSRNQLLLEVPAVATASVALLVQLRRPDTPVGWLLGAFAILLSAGSAGSNYVDHGLYGQDVPAALVAPIGLMSNIAGTVFANILIQLALVFPDGHPLSRRWRLVAWLNLAAGVAAFGSLLDPSAIGDTHRHITNPIAPAGDPGGLGLISLVQGLTLIGLVAVALGSLVVRFRRADSDVRQQVKWFGAGLGLLTVGVILGQTGSSQGSAAGFPTNPTALATLVVGISALPICIGVAVLRYRLYDLDVAIKRTLVYGALAALITAIYLAIVVGIGTLVGSGGRSNLLLSIIATAVVAIGFQPARDRLQKIANLLVYGKRATPYEVLSDFSERMADSYSGEEVLLRMARVLADGTGAELAEVWLRGGSRLTRAASWPAEATPREPLPITGQLPPSIPGADRVVPVRQQGELLGALMVTKPRGESLTPIEHKLVDDLANQAGLVLKNVGLTADLQARLADLRASSQRLVTAQDEERRRLERNLHDGAQQHLVALKIKIGIATALAEKDPARSKATLVELSSDADDALQNLRDLARGIYPPMLADQGLGPALVSQVRKATIPVTVETDGVGRYPQELESAIYFCCLEALQNVQKYASADAAVVTLSQSDGWVRFEVSDNGRGFDTEATKLGAGLRNMADRLLALGGEVAVESSAGHGTTVRGTIPARAVVS